MEIYVRPRDDIPYIIDVSVGGYVFGFYSSESKIVIGFGASDKKPTEFSVTVFLKYAFLP